jgi:hypothetical protein
VFRPEPPRLFTLNTSAWLALELCPGRSPGELERAYLDETVPPLEAEVARRRLHEALDLLLANGMIERLAGTDRHAGEA